MNIIERMKLDGKKALVTGAGQGLGKAFALALAEAGADVAIADINIENARKVSKEIISLGRKSIPIKAVEDLKGALIYLASETSDFMVGQDIVIDGAYINI